MKKINSEHEIIEFSIDNLIESAAKATILSGFPLPENIDLSKDFVRGSVNRDGETIYFAIVYIDDNTYNYGISNSDSLLADVWKTKIMDEAYEDLRERLCDYARKANIFISELMGPGYFEMPITETKMICEKSRAHEIGIRAFDDGRMEPAFSRCGFFLTSKEPNLDKQNTCQNCDGNKNGCSMCSLFTRKK